jgi:hypothetical protein
MQINIKARKIDFTLRKNARKHISCIIGIVVLEKIRQNFKETSS